MANLGKICYGIWSLTVSKLRSESTAFDLALLSCVFISRLYLVLHSVMMMVRAENKCQIELDIKICLLNVSSYNMKCGADSTNISTALTEVEEHANEDNEAEPGTEVRHKIDDGNDDVSNSGHNAKHNVAVTQINNEHLKIKK